jgi:hypothetical protein
MQIVTTITTGLSRVGSAVSTVIVENHNFEIRSEMDEITKEIQALRAKRSELKSQLIEL